MPFTQTITPSRISNTSSSSQGFYSKNSTPGAGTEAAYDASISGLQKLPAMISTIYSRLIASGKNDDAWMLRDATEKFANSGKGLGVNSFARASALNALRGRLTAAANTREAQISKSEADDLINIEREIARLGAEKAQALFSQGFQTMQWKDKVQADQIAQFNAQQNAIRAAAQARMGQQPTIAQPRPSNPASTIIPANTTLSPTAIELGRKWQAEADARSGLTEMARGVNATAGTNVYGPGYVDATMGNLRFLQGATDWLGRPISNQTPQENVLVTRDATGGIRRL